MNAYEDLLRALLVERFGAWIHEPPVTPTQDDAATADGLRPRRRTGRHQNSHRTARRPLRQTSSMDSADEDRRRKALAVPTATDVPERRSS
jgi:hypothetical protein